MINRIISSELIKSTNVLKGNKPDVSIESETPKDTATICYQSGSILAKSLKGWQLLGNRLYQSRIVQGHQKIKSGITNALKAPFKGIMKKIEEIAGDDDDKQELEQIKKESSGNLTRFADEMKSYPSSIFLIKCSIKGDPEYSDDSFWEKHPIARSFYLGFKAIRKIPKMLFKIPRALFRIMLPAAYGQSGNTKMVGENFVYKMLAGLRKKPWFNTAMNNYKKLLDFPGVSLALSIMGPVFAINRMSDGLMEYQEGLKKDNPYQKLDGKVDIMTGALAAVRPLALLAIATEGVHIYLNYRVKKKGMDPAKADRIMSNVFAAVTAPIGLAAYAFLSPDRADGSLPINNIKKINGDVNDDEKSYLKRFPEK